jgi:anti-sigma B factor antagonist
VPLANFGISLVGAAEHAHDGGEEDFGGQQARACQPGRSRRTGSSIPAPGGVPVVTAPEEIDLTNTAGLRTALLGASARGRGTFVVDMSQTRFCDSAGIHALVGAHNRSRAEGGEMLLAVSATAVLRVFAITGIDRLIPNFATLPEALAHTNAAQPAGRTRHHRGAVNGVADP